MDTHFIIRGIPASLARDAWWFTDEEASSGDTKDTCHDTASRPLPPKALAALALLVVLGDLLFWDTDLGISVALYVLALAACMVALKPGGVTRKEAAIALGFVGLCTLPVVELVQPLSLAFCGAGIAGLFIWITFGTSARVKTALLALVEASLITPFALPIDTTAQLRRKAFGLDLPALSRTLALPLGIGALFLALFTVANPLVEGTFARIATLDVLSAEHFVRMIFWLLAACFLWPYLIPRGPDRVIAHTGTRITLPALGLVNARSVLVSLAMFNVIFAVQTVSDLGVLTGGVALPEGLTYAEYAHRGAYPLMVTAALSGMFALATQSLVADNTRMRALMYLWLGQNLFLVITAAVRLGLYVDAYGLTYLRVAAFIWMALVFVALVLIVVQMVQKRGLGWLISGNAIAVASTLYVCCFINFTYLITDYNLAHTPPEALDLAYLCALGEQVIPAMMDLGQITDQTACGHGPYPTLRFDPIHDWQEWGFRRWRLQRYLEIYHDL